jgi:hypothetical protein
MANNLTSNVSSKVARVIAAGFEASTILVNAVNTTYVSGEDGITPATGASVYLKRKPQYKAIETSSGDISASTKNDIGVGRIQATVQNFITVPIDIPNLDQVTSLDQMKELLMPAADECVTRLELNIGQKLLENAGMIYGTPGTAVTTWENVAGINAFASSLGMPDTGTRYYAMRPFTSMKLASAQGALSAADTLVQTAWQNAQIPTGFAGVRALVSNSLKSYTSGGTTDRIGAFAATPNATWATHKDTMIQTWSLNAFSASVTGALKPGDVLEVTGRYHINVATRQIVQDATGAPMKFRATVVTGGDTDVSGAVSVTVTMPGIFGSSGSFNEQFQTVDSALTSGDVVTVLGAASTSFQPNLFFHQDAFALATIKLPPLNATSTYIETKKGLSLRVTQYSDGDKNLNRWRMDMLPVMGVVNPLFIGKSFG